MVQQKRPDIPLEEMTAKELSEMGFDKPEPELAERDDEPSPVDDPDLPEDGDPDVDDLEPEDIPEEEMSDVDEGAEGLDDPADLSEIEKEFDD